MDICTRDFIKLVTLIKSFHKQQNIQTKLNFIHEWEISDWEKWLQLELEFYLSKNNSVAELSREYRYKVDRRKSGNSKHFFVDFSFRLKHSLKGQYINIELKQAHNMSTCIRDMVKDVGKYQTVLKSNCDARSFWCIGYFQNWPSNSIGFLKEDVVNTINDSGLVFDEKLLELFKVGRNTYCLIF